MDWLLVLLIAPFSFGQQQRNQLSLELSIPHTGELACINNCSSLLKAHVIIHNDTDSTTYFYEDWNTYGYYNITFEIQHQNTVYPITRPEKYWYRNYPSFFMLHSGESLVFPYAIVDTTCVRLWEDNGIFENGWIGFPNISDTVEIRAIYQLCHLEDSIPGERIGRLNDRSDDYVDYLDGDIEAPLTPNPNPKAEPVFKPEIIFHEPLYSSWQSVILLH